MKRSLLFNEIETSMLDTVESMRKQITELSAAKEAAESRLREVEAERDELKARLLPELLENGGLTNVELIKMLREANGKIIAQRDSRDKQIQAMMNCRNCKRLVTGESGYSCNIDNKNIYKYGRCKCWQWDGGENG